MEMGARFATEQVERSTSPLYSLWTFAFLLLILEPGRGAGPIAAEKTRLRVQDDQEYEDSASVRPAQHQ